jgi:acid phosphatase
MIKLRKIPSFLCVVLPALTWVGCGSDDDNATPSAGAGGVSAGHGGASGGSSAGKGGTESGGESENTAGSTEPPSEGGSAGEGEGGGAGEGAVDPVQTNIDTIVFIYAENRSFDNMFGNFPNAHNLSEVIDAQGNPTDKYVPQKDRDGTTELPKLPKTWGGATAAGNPTVVPVELTDNLPNKPFGIENAFVPNGGSALTTADVTRDLTHKFFENIMEINGGTNDMFAAWLDAGGLTMGHFDNSGSKLYKLAQDYVLADNFFEGAFGGSFLNHQYLICGCAPSLPGSFVANNSPTINVLGTANAKGVPQLAQASSSPASALDGPPTLQTGNVAPLDYFGAGDGYRAVNTMQAPFQPSGNAPAAGATDLRYANAASGTTVPPQTQTTIGDLLTTKGVTWAWYAGSWNAAVADGMQASTVTRSVIYTPSTPRGNPDFQPHHHPFNYYARFDPAVHASERTEHLRDYTQLLTDITAGTLPHVVYYKPQGNNNQHPGYANVDDGDAHIADLVDKLKAGAQWEHMVIVITYDEYGGQWDHVAPPKGDKYGPGSRIPALIISPFAKAGTVDHTQYDTGSITRLITRRFELPTLPGVAARDQALVQNGGTAMGDLSNALELP